MQKELLNQKICVVGMGYVGLTLALTFAKLGFRVFGIEKRQPIVDQLKSGKAHFYEPELDDLLVSELKHNFELLTELKSGMADIYILAIGTPVEGTSKKPNFADLAAVSDSLGWTIKRGDLVLLRSTVPPSTTRNFVIPRLEKNSGLKAGVDFDVAFAPERTIEGKALKELYYLPQVVGGVNEKSLIRAENLFKTMTPNIVRVKSLEAAEMVKIINNLYRDVTFAFANEMALACDKFNLDSHEVIKAANEGYERSRVPLPSPGVGGYCLTKDPYILFESVREKGGMLPLIMQARSVNRYMPHYIGGQVDKFFKIIGKNSVGAKAFILGLAFKGDPPTSDTRYSPSFKIGRILREKGLIVYGYDPMVTSKVTQEHEILPASLEEGFRGADVVVLATNHPDFKILDLNKYLKLSNQPVLFFDGWHLHSPEKVSQIVGAKYSNLGYDNISL